MLSHLGLRSRMAASYVIVSAAAVLLVEAALLAVMVPRVRAADRAAQQAQERAAQAEHGLVQLKAQTLAGNLATAISKAVTVGASDAPGRTDAARIASVAASGFRDLGGESKGMVQVVADAGGRVLAASPAQAYATNALLPAAARTGPPRDGQSEIKTRTVYWATAPIQAGTGDGEQQRTIGIAYVELSDKPAPQAAAGAPGGRGTGDEPTVAPGDAPQTTAPTASEQPVAAPAQETTIASLVLPGAVALVLLVPVGALFGLLSTGRLIRRVRRLADSTSAMSGGDLRVRIPVSGGDEVGRLELAFNAMAERLEAAIAEQRAAAGADARRAERGRIARELHDSISQDLFSVSLVAAGMRKALSPGSALRWQAEAMEASLARTMREMRALLLELRPIQLEDAGLTAAIEELCRTYEARLGIPVSPELDPVVLDAAAEHAVLRVVQESVGNAIRHGDPSSIAVRLVAIGDRVEVTVRDDGRGFDPNAAGSRHGMGLSLMRERLHEIGGAVEIDSAPEHGTMVRVTLPRRPAGVTPDAQGSR